MGEIAIVEKNEIGQLQKIEETQIAFFEITQEAANILTAPINVDDIEIRPDGLIYMPQAEVRNILNKAFRPGNWRTEINRTIFPTGVQIQNNNVFYHGNLIVFDKIIADAIGEQVFYPNGNMTYASAIEAAKSNFIIRACKDLGIGNECWQPKFAREWISKYATTVELFDKKGQLQILWYRKDDSSFVKTKLAQGYKLPQKKNPIVQEAKKVADLNNEIQGDKYDGFENAEPEFTGDTLGEYLHREETKADYPVIGQPPTKEQKELYWLDKKTHADWFALYPELEICDGLIEKRGTYKLRNPK